MGELVSIDEIFAVEVPLYLIFTVEFLLRWWCCDALGTSAKRHFLLGILNLFDIIALLPVYLKAVSRIPGVDFETTPEIDVLKVMRIFRLIQLTQGGKKREHLAPVALIVTLVWGI